jgi:hypothetical protein
MKSNCNNINMEDVYVDLSNKELLFKIAEREIKSVYGGRVGVNITAIVSVAVANVVNSSALVNDRYVLKELFRRQVVLTLRN